MKKAQENKQDESANNSYSLSYQTLWKAIIRPPRMTYTNDELGNPYFKYRNRLYFRRDFELLNNQGHILKCSFVEPTKEHRKTRDMPVVIYLHGNSSSRLEGLKMLTVVLRHDINLFVLDFAGSGQSEGEYISLGHYEQQDVRLVVDYIEKMQGVSKIGLWGRSMGAATTMLYAHKDERISAICMDSPFAEFRRLAKEMCLNVISIPDFLLETAINIVSHTVKKKHKFDIDELKPIEAAKVTETPAIFIHAKNDELIPLQHTIDIAEEYNGPRSIKVCEGGHNSARPRIILEEIGRFFAKNLVPGYIDEREVMASIFDENNDSDQDDNQNEKTKSNANTTDNKGKGFESL